MIPRLYDYTMIDRIGDRPVSAMELASHLKIDTEAVTGQFHVELENMIDAAIITAENMTKRTLINSSFVAYMDGFYPGASYEIRKSPVNTITSINYSIGGVQTIFPDTSYYLAKSQMYSAIGLTAGNSWPTHDNVMHAIEISFTAGYTTLPSDIKIAVMMIAAMLYSNRGDCDVSGDVNACSMPVAVRNILKKYRIPSLRVGF